MLKRKFNRVEESDVDVAFQNHNSARPISEVISAFLVDGHTLNSEVDV